jgi:hypothetical protein
MPGARVIGFVHGDGHGVVIDCNVRITPQGHPDSFGCAASSGEEIDD